MREFYTFPNLLSLTRVGLGAMAMLWIVSGPRAYLIGAAVLVALGELTDFLDGWLARRTGGGTVLGRSLDAACDAIFHLSVFLALLIMGWMPLWAAVAIYAAEIALPYLRSFAKQLGAEMPPQTLDAVRSGAHGVTAIAVIALAYIENGRLSVSGFGIVPAIFAADVLITLAAMTANVWPLVRALRMQHRAG